MGTMKTKPIIFSSHMIKALLEGRKTQTRRILDNPCDEPPAIVLDGIVTAFDEHYRPYRWPRTYAAGELLWTKETFWGDEYGMRFKADGHISPMGWSPSIHMPRWASRLTLEVTDVRVERLIDISEDDVRAEGIAELSKDDGRTWKWGLPDQDGWPGTDDHGEPWSEWTTCPQDAFARLWNSIYGDGAWDENPWVAAYSFTVHHRNVDDLLAEREVTA